MLLNVDAVVIEDLSETESRVFAHAWDRAVPPVWVFHGDGARFASAVFESETDAAAWIARHGLSDVLTEYPVSDGCYDIAVCEGRSDRRSRTTGRPSTSPRSRPAGTRHTHFGHDRPASPEGLRRPPRGCPGTIGANVQRARSADLLGVTNWADGRHVSVWVSVEFRRRVVASFGDGCRFVMVGGLPVWARRIVRQDGCT